MLPVKPGFILPLLYGPLPGSPKFAVTMTIPIYVAGVVVVGLFLYRFLYGTDTPHIKGLPEVPGLPLFGSLFELGTNHAKVAQGWAKKYGPVFQVRMGNRVRLPQKILSKMDRSGSLTSIAENRVRQHLRLGPPSLDHEPVGPHLPTNTTHLPHSCLFLARLHNWYFTMGRIMQEPTQSSCHCTEPTRCTVLHASHRPRIHRLHQGAST
jgi:hypothetical protein